MVTVYIPPYKEDFFHRITDLQFHEGAVVITGNTPGVCYYKATSAKSKPGLLPILGLDFFGDSSDVWASSYARVKRSADGQVRPTFLVGGVNNASSADEVGFIYVSEDGLTWSTAFSGPQLSVNNLVWDKRALSFYADVSDETIGDQSVCYASADGRSWAPGGGSFASHCAFGLPDGQFGYDEQNKMFIKATDIGARTLTFAGGVWAKAIQPIGADDASSRVLWLSYDRTKTWVNAGSIPSDNDTILTICAAPLGDLAPTVQ